MNKFLIDGRFLVSMSTGVDRYADQILHELDKICSDVDLSILVPGNAKKIPEYKNIRIIRSRKKRFWTQGVFGVYARVHRMIPINLCNEVSLLAPGGIVCLHDVCYAETKEVYPQLSDFSQEEISWFCKLYQRIRKKAKMVLTVSEFSKHRIEELVGIEANRIHVISNGWQHYESIPVNDSFMNQYPQLKEKNYYFTLTSANKNKNLDWVLQTSRLNLNETFVLAGKNLDQNVDLKQYPNVLYVGFASDELVKTLMAHCKAFLFPSYYEGFGIPPMEAMSAGATVVVSQVASLPEIFGKTAHYIDPAKPQNNLDELIREPVDARELVLEHYSWKHSAMLLHQLLKEW